MLLFQYIVLISIFLFLIIWWYYTSLTKNSKNLNIILQKGICPNCKRKILEEDLDSKGGGCSGTNNLSFKCSYCKYSNSFNIQGQSSCSTNQNSCSSGKCKM